jgi:hypothetical protein
VDAGSAQEARENKNLERFYVSMKHENALARFPLERIRSSDKKSRQIL